MRDPEALQIGPGAVARVRSPILIKTSISFPYSRLRSLLPALAGKSLRVLPIVKGLRRGGRGRERGVVSPRRSEGKAPRRTRCRARMRDPEALQIGPGAVARFRRGGRSPEPDFNKDPHFISIFQAPQSLTCFGR